MPGQTLREIRQLLAAAGLKPRHRYGQNFLIDLNLMRKLAEAADVQAGDVILEVGCGTGSLTEILLDRGVRVIGVEIDHGLQRILRERFGEHPDFTLVQADALETKHRVNPLILNLLARREPTPGRFRRLVANLPYQIATPLLMELLYIEPSLERLVCTIQKEVGERLAAQPESQAYGPVSIIMQTLAEVSLLAILPPTAFWPRPKVESVMVAVRPRHPEDVGVTDIPRFVALVAARVPASAQDTAAGAAQLGVGRSYVAAVSGGHQSGGAPRASCSRSLASVSRGGSVVRAFGMMC